MMLFLVLAPFGVLAGLMLVTTPVVSLLAAGAVAVGTIGYDLFRGRSIKALAAGAAAMFVTLGLYLAVSGRHMGDHELRLTIDLGVLAIALCSIALRTPFTLQYAREVVSADVAHAPAFMTTNYILSWAWTGAFVLMLAADILMLYWPSLPLWVGVGIAFAARNCAIDFTNRYSAHRRALLAQQAS